MNKMRIETLNPIIDDRWMNFISSHPDSSIFHHPAWLKVLKEQYKFKVFLICLIDGNGVLKGGIPFCEVLTITRQKKWISLPFSDMCYPLYKDEETLNQLQFYLADQKKKDLIPDIEIRSPLNNIYSDNQKLSYVKHVIRLINNPDLIYKTFSKSRVRETISQSLRRGVSVRFCDNKQDLMKFYNLLISTRRRLGTPVQPKNFFYLIWDQLIEKRLGFILLAYSENKLISGVLYLHFNGTLTAKYNGSDHKYWRLRANNLIYWHSIKWGCENGFKIFDFGRTDIDNRNLRDFKNGWGTEETNLHYSYFPTPKESHLFKFVSNKIVQPIIKYSPPLFCRLSGELLYKYFP